MLRCFVHARPSIVCARQRNWIRCTSNAVTAVPELLLQSKWSPSGLGIASTFVTPGMLDSLQKLPEVEQGLQEHSVDHLNRAVEVFQSIREGGPEHVACLAMLAEMKRCQETLDELHRLCQQDPHTQIVVELAKAKLGWLEGELDCSFSITSAIVDRLSVGNHLPSILHSARTGLGINRLFRMSTIDDAFSVRDPFRQVVAQVKPLGSPVIMAAAYLNLGVAEAMYANAVGKFNDVEVPLDPAMVAWKNGLTQLKRSGKHQYIEALLHCNMAWGMLQMKGESDAIVRATEFASNALKCINNSQLKFGIDRILCIVATCAHLSGDAVTAQGLFASALDIAKKDPSVLGLSSQREILKRYAKLCKSWEKRESEADALERQAESIELPQCWDERSFVDRSLWLWFPDIKG